MLKPGKAIAKALPKPSGWLFHPPFSKGGVARPLPCLILPVLYGVDTHIHSIFPQQVTPRFSARRDNNLLGCVMGVPHTLPIQLRRESGRILSTFASP